LLRYEKTNRLWLAIGIAHGQSKRLAQHSQLVNGVCRAPFVKKRVLK
jgi:hypothetical protein